MTQREGKKIGTDLKAGFFTPVNQLGQDFPHLGKVEGVAKAISIL